MNTEQENHHNTELEKYGHYLEYGVNTNAPKTALVRFLV